MLRLYSSASSLKTIGMGRGDFTCAAFIENWLVAVDLCREAHWKLKLQSGVNLSS